MTSDPETEATPEALILSAREAANYLYQVRMIKVLAAIEAQASEATLARDFQSAYTLNTQAVQVISMMFTTGMVHLDTLDQGPVDSAPEGGVVGEAPDVTDIMMDTLERAKQRYNQQQDERQEETDDQGDEGGGS